MPHMLIAAIACHRSGWQQVSSASSHVCAATYGFLAGLIQTLNPQSLKHSRTGDSVIADLQSPCNSGNGIQRGPSSAETIQPSLDFTSLQRLRAGAPIQHKGANTASNVQRTALMHSM